MREFYVNPKLEITIFDAEDIITTSTDSDEIIELPFIPAN